MTFAWSMFDTMMTLLCVAFVVTLVAVGFWISGDYARARRKGCICLWRPNSVIRMEKRDCPVHGDKT